MATFPQRAELYWIPSQVPEGEDEKDRPVVIPSRDELNRRDRVIIVPFWTSQLEKRKREPWCASFSAGEGGLLRDCVARGDLVQLIDPAEIVWSRGKLGRLNNDQLLRVFVAVRHAFRDHTLV